MIIKRFTIVFKAPDDTPDDATDKGDDAIDTTLTEVKFQVAQMSAHSGLPIGWTVEFEE